MRARARDALRGSRREPAEGYFSGGQPPDDLGFSHYVCPVAPEREMIDEAADLEHTLDLSRPGDQHELAIARRAKSSGCEDCPDATGIDERDPAQVKRE